MMMMMMMMMTMIDTTQIREVVPPWAFFIASALLIFFIILDALYVGWLYKNGRVHTMWPVKLLRFLVTLLITTLYSNVLQFAIFPVNCFISTDEADNITWLLNRSKACTPFGAPQIAVTIVSLLLACIFIVFALTTSYLSFEINPLSRHPMALCTGLECMCMYVCICMYSPNLV
jgi:hypothetical protein